MSTCGQSRYGGNWMVIALTNSKGTVTTLACEGSDPELALDEYLRTTGSTNPRWLVHYERGFESRADAEKRAQLMNSEIGANSERTQSTAIQ